ncbi:hypothetical protein LUX57_29555 [Actinomadura madurae]|uniref:hypothetical protein n=1 Tax=Actinomadura madurae TaxID=1993 RepID=UPI0020D1FD7C|nr:hypothetical protein [Actinomadura madurae]MCP9968806.1 hypothetical protein [Actinomadura madurae]
MGQGQRDMQARQRRMGRSGSLVMPPGLLRAVQVDEAQAEVGERDDLLAGAGEEGEVLARQARADRDEAVLVHQAREDLRGRPPGAGLRRARPDRLQAFAELDMPLLHPLSLSYSGRPREANPRVRPNRGSRHHGG